MALTEEKLRELNTIACHVRTDIVEMLHKAGSGHTGGSLSAADIVTALYFHKMRHRPGEPDWPDRDRFILSKGHAAPVLYAALARSGYFPLSELSTLRKFGSRLQGHPDPLEGTVAQHPDAAGERVVDRKQCLAVGAGDLDHLVSCQSLVASC